MKPYVCMLALCLAPLLRADMQTFDIKSLDRFESKAEETTVVTLDSNLLRMAARFLSKDDPDAAKVKKLVSGLQGVFVRSFTFKNAGAYDEADLKWLREQMKGPGWSRIVGVKSKKEGENAEIFLHTNGENKIGGLTIIAAEPKELTVVQILGDINLDDLSSLESIGVPDLRLTAPRKDHDKKERK